MIDVLASEPQYATHLRPIYGALPPEIRGSWLTSAVQAEGDRAVLVASYSDHRRVRRAGYRHIAVTEHGIGQSYSNSHPSYPGGRDRGDAELFLTPNNHSAERWRAAYPEVQVEVVGSPVLDFLWAKVDGPETVAIAFHWDCRVAPETRWAWDHYAPALPDLAREFNLIVHGHPRAAGFFRLSCAKLGIEYVDTFEEVCQRADVFVADNSSTLFEFASTGRPVVVLNDPRYRRDVEHGLRFWDAATVGEQVWQPERLAAAVHSQLRDSVEWRKRRERALALVYARRSGAAARAADVLAAWAYGALAA